MTAKRGRREIHQGKDPDWPIRVAVHLEEAPAFHFVPRERSAIPAITWRQRERSWVIRGDSQVGFGGAFTQRLWLALMAMYEAGVQQTGEVGVVYYSKGLLAERMRIPRNGNRFEAIDVGLVQLDALRAYVTGRPLPGPEADEIRPLHHYQAALVTACGPPCEAGYLIPVEVELRRQPRNKHDRNAIAAHLLPGGAHIGFLRREIAAVVAPAVDEAGLERWTVPGVIRGGRTRAANLGVHLWLERLCTDGATLKIDGSMWEVPWPPKQRELDRAITRLR